MRCPKCHTETSAEALNCPSCNLSTPRGKYVNAEKSKSDKVKPDKADKKSRSKTRADWGALMPGKWVNWVLLGVVFVVLGLGVYWYVYHSSQSLQPQSAMAMMEELRKMPSKEEGKTIDDCMTAKLQQSKEAGHLLNYQGWTVKPYARNTYLISFAFEERDGKKSADWIVDPQNKIYTPINELATATHKE